MERSADPCSRTLLDLVRSRALASPTERAFTFLLDDDAGAVAFTNAELDTRARGIAAVLQDRVRPGDRALMLFPPGLDFVPAFFGCVYAGVIPVPTYPPDPRRLTLGIERLAAIVQDARPTVVLVPDTFAGL